MEVQTQTVEVPVARPSHELVQVCVGLLPPKELPKRETLIHYDIFLYSSHVIENYSPAFPNSPANYSPAFPNRKKKKGPLSMNLWLNEPKPL
jgi:hypothetical protein